jgi:predicted enzyme related to lactoylglutathione lyase
MSIAVNEIAFFCYPVIDFDRALKFYQDTLGLKLSFAMPPGNGPRWAEFDIAGGTLAIGKAPGMEPAGRGGVVGLEVADFDAAVASLKAAGVTFTMEPFFTGVCHMAGILDPEGNPVLIHKRQSQPGDATCHPV